MVVAHRYNFCIMMHWYEWVSWIANIALVMVGAGGIWVAVCTLKKIERQTKAGEDAAKAAKDGARAALAQANHMITAERAWLVVEAAMADFTPSVAVNMTFRWSIRNGGRTPAKIIGTQCVYQMVFQDELTSLPPDPVFPSSVEAEGLLLVPGGSEFFSVYLVDSEGRIIPKLGEKDRDGIWYGIFYLRAYGHVKYFDTFGNERESRFCQYYVSPDKSKTNNGFQHLLGIPAAYRQHT
jgi:hypothetical protein